MSLPCESVDLSRKCRGVCSNFLQQHKQKDRRGGHCSTEPEVLHHVHPMSRHHDMRGTTTCTALPDPLQLLVFGTTPVSAKLWLIAQRRHFEVERFQTPKLSASLVEPDVAITEGIFQNEIAAGIHSLLPSSGKPLSERPKVACPAHHRRLFIQGCCTIFNRGRLHFTVFEVDCIEAFAKDCFIGPCLRRVWQRCSPFFLPSSFCYMRHFSTIFNISGSCSFCQTGRRWQHH